MGTFFADGEVVDDAAHACNFAPEAVVEGGGDAEDDSSCGCVVEGVGVDVDHKLIRKMTIFGIDNIIGGAIS